MTSKLPDKATQRKERKMIPNIVVTYDTNTGRVIILNKTTEEHITLPAENVSSMESMSEFNFEVEPTEQKSIVYLKIENCEVHSEPLREE